MRQYTNFVHALSKRTVSINASNFRSYFHLFSVRFKKEETESKELSCSVFGLGLRLNGRLSRNYVSLYFCVRVYLHRALAVAEKQSLQLPQ